MWRYVTRGQYVYSFGYRQRPKGLGGETFLRFYRSRDGANWETITQSDAGGGYVNEAAFAFQPDDRCVVLLRREGGNSRLGLARPPYKDWTWTDIPAGERDTPFTLQANRFIDQLEGKPATLCSLEAAQHTLRFNLAALAAADSGTRVQCATIGI